MRNASKTTLSATQRTLSLVILAVLVLIAALVLVRQASYDPSLWRAQAQDQGALGKGQPTGALPATPDDDVSGLKPLSPPENYQTDTLSNKINGKAELYLAAGFQHLQSRRFGLADQPDQWMERFIYDMGKTRGAFAVFSAQRRSNIQPFDVTPHAYQASNGLFFVHGRYYVEIIAAQLSENLKIKMQDLAQAFVAAWQATPQPLEELDYFPTPNLVPYSQALSASSAFGLDRLNWIYTARYQKDQAEAVAFITKRVSPQEAYDLAGAFSGYWLD